MEFARSDDQCLLQDSLRAALSRACPLARVRAAALREGGEGREGPDPELWATACELGLPALLVPPSHGGLGLSLLDAALAAEELGRRAAPLPFLGTAVLAVIALIEGGSREQQDAWLQRLALGQARLGVALEGTGVECVEGRLRGSTMFVIDGIEADGWLVATPAGSLHLVARGAPGVQCTALRTVDATRPCARLDLDGVPAQPLAGGEALLARLRDAADVLLAADALGAAQTMLDQALAYARERRQFGRVIGSFQAVKHLCAEMAAELESRRALVWFAAHAFDERLDQASLHAAHAKAQLGEAAQFVARSAIEVHGGMGITDDLGLHHWFKRVGMDRQLLGGPEQARRRAAALQGWA